MGRRGPHLQGAAIALYGLVGEAWQLALAVTLFAVGFGGGIPTRPAFQAQYFGLRAFGAIQGLVMSVATVGGMVGPVLAGAVFDWVDSYRPAFLLLGLAGAMAAPLLWTAGPAPVAAAPKTIATP